MKGIVIVQEVKSKCHSHSNPNPHLLTYSLALRVICSHILIKSVTVEVTSYAQLYPITPARHPLQSSGNPPMEPALPLCRVIKYGFAHTINQTILSVTLLHSLRFLHLLLAVAKPIFLSSHASFTPSIHLRRGLPHSKEN